MRTKRAESNCHRCILHHCSPEHAFKRLNPNFLIHRLTPAFASEHLDSFLAIWYTPMSAAVYFFGPNLGAPMLAPLNLMPRTRSMLASTFWSGVAVPFSNCWTMEAVVLHFVAKSFWVIFGSIFWRWAEMALPTTLPMVFGLTISSERSTLVKCCPSTPGLEAC